MILRGVTVATEAPIGGEKLLMAGVDLSRFRAGAIPVLIDHANSARAVVGNVLDLRVEGDALKADLDITDPELSAAMERGQHYNISIGYETSNEYTAPDGTTVAGTTRIFEISLVGVGADPDCGTDRKEAEVKTRTTETPPNGGNNPPNPAPPDNPAPSNRTLPPDGKETEA